jgi:S-adenosylmethionine:tRNA ribosyltransferase-isomerase
MTEEPPYRLSDFVFFDLPPELIAQNPAPSRDQSRLMLVNRRDGCISHHRFSEFPTLLPPHCLIVLNNTKVFPARLMGKRLPDGARVEILLVREERENLWEAMARPANKLRKGVQFRFADGSFCTVLEVPKPGRRLLRFEPKTSMMELLENEGITPLPPYIRRAIGTGFDTADRERYQTVYAARIGSVAAPTAGLHFTEEILGKIESRHFKTAYVTLHIGPGTFTPIKDEDIRKHKMEEEQYEISAEAARRLEEARSAHANILAIGTSTVRVLESFREEREFTTHVGKTGIFIAPGFRFRWVSALLTNFHLPRSTNLVLVSAFAGIDLIREAYRKAVEERYRFYSFGDCMLIL